MISVKKLPTNFVVVTDIKYNRVLKLYILKLKHIERYLAS